MFVLSPHLLHRMLLRVTALGDGGDTDERGASAVEYGLLVAGIAAVIVGTVFILGQGVFLNLFTETCNSISQNQGTTC
jgi:pilus assembly protein Flp/PilA